MNSTEGDSHEVRILTEIQRRKIYEEVKKKLERERPLFSRGIRLICAIYVVGCGLLYFGLPQSLVTLWSTREWVYQPERDLFRVLGSALIELARPILAVLVFGWMIAIPLAIPVGIWSYGKDTLRFVKRFFGR